MDNDPESPPPSPAESAYDDVRVGMWIESMHIGIASDDRRVQLEALSDMMRFAVTYYDDGVSRDSQYFAALLTPVLMQQLRNSFFIPDLTEQVARVMDAIIPENWKRLVAHTNFVMQLCQAVAYRPVDDCFICSATLIIRKLVAYGDHELKTLLFYHNIVDLLLNFVAEYLQFAGRHEVLDEAMTHIIWTAGELIPVSDMVLPAKTGLLYDILKECIKSRFTPLVREVISVMDLLCYDPHSAQYLPRNELVACLLWVTRHTPEWHSVHAEEILIKVVKLVHSLLLSGHNDITQVVLNDIQNTWTAAGFFSFLVKDHTNRHPAVVEVAISMLQIVTVEELVQADLIPHIIQFVSNDIVSDAREASKHVKIGLQNLFPLLRSFVSPQTDGQSVLRVIDAGIFYVITLLLEHFAADGETTSTCDSIITDLMEHPDAAVRCKVITQLQCSSLVKQRMVDLCCSRDPQPDMGKQILSDPSITSAPAADVTMLLLMNRMRLG